TIIKNTSGSAIAGHFAGLPEGAGMTVSGSIFRITYVGGTSHDDVVLTVVTATTTTTISPASSTTTYGQSATFTAHVSGSQGIPTGTVDFYNGNPNSGGTVIGMSPLNGVGDADFSISTLPVAGSPHPIFAVYIPDNSTTYAGSTSATPAALTVNPATLTV